MKARQVISLGVFIAQLPVAVAMSVATHQFKADYTIRNGVSPGGVNNLLITSSLGFVYGVAVSQAVFAFIGLCLFWLPKAWMVRVLAAVSAVLGGLIGGAVYSNGFLRNLTPHRTLLGLTVADTVVSVVGILLL